MKKAILFLLSVIITVTVFCQESSVTVSDKIPCGQLVEINYLGTDSVQTCNTRTIKVIDTLTRTWKLFGITHSTKYLRKRDTTVLVCKFTYSEKYDTVKSQISCDSILNLCQDTTLIQDTIINGYGIILGLNKPRPGIMYLTSVSPPPYYIPVNDTSFIHSQYPVYVTEKYRTLFLQWFQLFNDIGSTSDSPPTSELIKSIKLRSSK